VLSSPHHGLLVGGNRRQNEREREGMGEERERRIGEGRRVERGEEGRGGRGKGVQTNSWASLMKSSRVRVVNVCMYVCVFQRDFVCVCACAREFMCVCEREGVRVYV